MATTTTLKMTADEFIEWLSRPENEDKRFELEDGEVVEMPSPGELHGFYCWLAIKLLTEYAGRRGSGYLLTNDTGLIVRRGPDTVRGPDIMMFLDQPNPAQMSKKFCDRVPALIVEVLSPNDRRGKTLRRIEQYHKRGIPLVWVIDPEELTVTVYRPNEFPKVLDESDELTGNGVLPEFSCTVRDLFTPPGSPPTPTPNP